MAPEEQGWEYPEDEAEKSFALPDSQRFPGNDHYRPHQSSWSPAATAFPSPSSRSTRGNYNSKPRTGHSPFFGGSKADYRARGLSSSPSQVFVTSPTAKGLQLTVSPESTGSQAGPALALSSPPLRTTTDSSASLRANQATSPDSTVPAKQELQPSHSRVPKRVLRPDHWWHSRTAQSSGLNSARPPPVPAKSPLRLLFTPSRTAPTRPAPVSTSLSDPSLSLEDRALWEELSPPPLFIRKSRPRVTPAQSETPSRPRKTFAPEDQGSQAVLESPELETPPFARDLALRRVLSRETFTETNKEQLAPRVEEELSARVRAHRQKTLEILESSPEADEEDSLPQRSKSFLQRRRVGARYEEMDSLHPDSAAAMTAHRREAVRLAEVQQRAVSERSKRSKQAEPDYAFDELIGKGSFGRVYKGRQLSTKKVVAIKVLDIDEADFHAYGDQKDEQIRDFNREIRILRQAQESGAENLNQMIEALPVHSQLWMICEYCPGGSVKTLMRATNDRLSEKYIVVVARELAKALKGLHEAGIMHRDVKAANVLIHQEGRLQLCDFGVATVLDTQTDKRKTFIGTLHWMPPELWTENPEYSDEVDVWEYGCTLYECAMGRPPNSDLRERQQLKMRMRRLKQAISLPENEPFSDGLRSLVSHALSPDVASRPSMKDLLQHDHIKDTEGTHPTSILTELVQTYYAWLFSGGQRISLFMPGGAAAASTQGLDADDDPMDEWNFSMTQDFERRVSAILEIPDFNVSSHEMMEGEETPKGSTRPSGLSPPKEMTAAQKANFEARVKRGADLSNIFDQSGPAYEYRTKTDFVPIPDQRRISDLPFRAMAEDRPSSIASNVIDLGDFDEADYAVAAAPRTDDKIQTTYAATPKKEETIRLADASTLREKRANSKGPRDPNNQSLTARRASSAEEVPTTSTSARDFAMAQEEWTVKNRNKAPELQEPAEITSSRPGHATMDWSFASAMSEAAIPQINAPAHQSPNVQVSEATPTDEDFEQKAKKHATMDWSFSSAMAEANASKANDLTPADGDKTQQQPLVGSSPPSHHRRQQTPSSSRPTPTRPAPLLRQMTMPVTVDDFANAEDLEIPRPSTALSEAYSDVSASSADVDPFGLERDSEDDHPGPATMDDDLGPSGGVGGFYSGRGRTMLGERVGGGGSGPSGGGGQHAGYPAGYQYSSDRNTPLTASGPAPWGGGGLGRPDSRGHVDDEFPDGPSSTSLLNNARASNSSVTSTGTAVAAGAAVNGAPRPPTAFVPSASPPGAAAMAAGASNEVLEAELTRLLEGMQGTLMAATEVVGGLENHRAARPTRSEEESEEWVDEEE